MKKGTMKKLVALILSAITVISLLAIPAFAEDAAPEAAKKGLTTQQLVYIIAFAVILVAIVVLCIVFREKLKKSIRVYKGEVKRIAWLPWDQTKKSTLVVIVVLVISAAAICLLDFGLSKGILAFIKLF